jgi:Transposase DDE domain
LFISRLFVKRIAARSLLSPKLPTHHEIEDLLVRERIHDVLSFPFAAYDIVRTQYSEVAHDHSLRADAGHQQRSQIAEFPHAWIKERCGLRQFRCRGQEKTGMEAKWACLSYNMIRLFSIRRKIANATVAAA